MNGMVTIENGFAEVGSGAWLMGRAQPAAFFGSALRRRRKGWVVRDRGSLDLVETTAKAKCADALRPFLTHIPCAEPIFAVSEKILVAPVSARKDAQTIRLIPMSMKSSLCVTEFGLSEEEDSAKLPGRGAPNFQTSKKFLGRDGDGVANGAGAGRRRRNLLRETRGGRRLDDAPADRLLPEAFDLGRPSPARPAQPSFDILRPRPRLD